MVASGQANVISTDVLVIGGGLSGVMAGIKAKENRVDVLVVDKGGIGWAGQMPLTGGHSIFLQPDKVEEWFQWAVGAGEYLNDQDWTYAIGNDNYKCVMETAEWGLPWLRTADGEVAVLQILKDYTSTRYSPAKFMVKLKQVAERKGVRTSDKVYIVDLLPQDGRIIGAIGFGLVDGKTYILKAKATVIANGDCMVQVHRLWVVNTGEGVAMAYRAGAQLRNAEFGAGGYGHGVKSGDYFTGLIPIYLFYENALGERLVAKYYPELAKRVMEGQKVDSPPIVNLIIKETEAGRGPIYLDFRKLTVEERKIVLRIESETPSEFLAVGRSSMLQFLREKSRLEPDKERIEIALRPPSMAGPIRVGLDCKTTVDGLWAVGDACNIGSGWTGARPSGSFHGYGVSFAIASGFRGGHSAGEYAAASGERKVDHREVNRLQERLLAPLGREGTIGAHEVVYQIQEAVVPIKYNLRREAGRLKEALGKIDRAEQQLTKVGAKDYHELMQYHQAESMVLCARLALNAELMREESRGTHRREDYPNRDDKNWLKWIIIQQEAGEDKFFTEPVPLEKYRLKPSSA